VVKYILDHMCKSSRENREPRHSRLKPQGGEEIPLTVITEAGAELLRQTKRWRGQFFTFMTDRDAPPTNNGAERALRPSVIFRKVTNGFRSLWGAEIHALTRSVIGTGRLNGITAHQAISRAIEGKAIFAA